MKSVVSSLEVGPAYQEIVTSFRSHCHVVSTELFSPVIVAFPEKVQLVRKPTITALYICRMLLKAGVANKEW